MMAFLNGKFVPEPEATISILDRGFLYGDGLFETLRIYHGIPFRSRRHLDRLRRGAEFLQIKLSMSDEALIESMERLIQTNGLREALLRISLSRGVGRRGYSIRGANAPCLAMTMHPQKRPAWRKPVRWRLATASLRLSSGHPLAPLKTCNKLVQILARTEAESKKADEALLLNERGEVAECSASNLFWMRGGALFTPPLAAGILPGVTREVIVELSESLGWSCSEKRVRPWVLRQADAVFLTLSSMGIVSVATLDGRALKQSRKVGELYRAYAGRVRRETRSFRGLEKKSVFA